MTAKEWIPETVSVWTQKGLGAGHPDAQIERLHPAPFSFTDVGRLIRFFTKRGAVVLDPFVGIGSTLKACALDGRRGIGIELNPSFAKLARERLASEVRDMFATTDQQTVLEGDVREILQSIPSSCEALTHSAADLPRSVRRNTSKLRPSRKRALSLTAQPQSLRTAIGHRV